LKVVGARKQNSSGVAADYEKLLEGARTGGTAQQALLLGMGITSRCASNPASHSSKSLRLAPGKPPMPRIAFLPAPTEKIIPLIDDR
jgi:hypothetical protein